MMKYIQILASASIVAMIALLLGEFFVRMVAGPPAYFLYTGSFHDVQTDWDVVYGVDADSRRIGCAHAAQDKLRRIAVIGDSFVFGQGVHDCRDFVNLLETEFDDIAFHNFGIIGAGLYEYMAVARDLLNTGYTDVLLVFYGNDISTLPAARGLKDRLADYSSMVALLRRIYRSYLVGRALHRTENETAKSGHQPSVHNNVISVISSEDKAYFRHVAEPAADKQQKFSAVFVRFAEILQREIDASRIYVAVVPDGSSVSRQLRDFILDAGGEPATFGQRGLSSRLIQELAENEGFQFMDIFPALQAGGDDMYFPHDLHWSPAGHARVAEELAKLIAPVLGDIRIGRN